MFGLNKNNNAAKLATIRATIDTHKALRESMAAFGATNKDTARLTALTADIRAALADVTPAECAELRAYFNA